MKFNFAASLISSALAYHGRQEGPAALLARQEARPVNDTEALITALEPLVNVEEPGCNAVITMIASDPATAQCCNYMHQLNEQTLASTPAANGWLDGYCSASCPTQYSVSAGRIVVGCTFKPQQGMSPAEVASVFRTTADIMAAVSCLKDPSGGYCVLTVWQSLQTSLDLKGAGLSHNPEMGGQIVSKLCEIPCGLQMLDAIQSYTGYNSSAVCAMLSSGAAPTLPPFAVPSTTAPSPSGTSAAEGPLSPTAAPSAPPEEVPSASSSSLPAPSTSPSPAPAGRLVRRLRDLLK